ncbi:hypothetical protein [Streptomyces albidoflavus]|uniref:hypothetical protein n=1 Tax=Streptomyces albidoflavus TaxID=1886 RepID=UPI00340960E1
MKALIKLIDRPSVLLPLMGVCCASLAYCAVLVSAQWQPSSETYAAYYSGVFAAMTTILTAVTLLLLVERVWARRNRKPLPVDPDNPPQRGVYIVEPQGPRERCLCHDRPIEDGAEVLLWPQPARFACIPKPQKKDA